MSKTQIRIMFPKLLMAEMGERRYVQNKEIARG